jgi:hypothetical protein
MRPQERREEVVLARVMVAKGVVGGDGAEVVDGGAEGLEVRSRTECERRVIVQGVGEVRLVERGRMMCVWDWDEMVVEVEVLVRAGRMTESSAGWEAETAW